MSRFPLLIPPLLSSSLSPPSLPPSPVSSECPGHAFCCHPLSTAFPDNAVYDVVALVSGGKGEGRIEGKGYLTSPPPLSFSCRDGQLSLEEPSQRYFFLSSPLPLLTHLLFLLHLLLLLQIGELFAPGVGMWTGFEWEDFPGLQNFVGTVMSISVRLEDVSIYSTLLCK